MKQDIPQRPDAIFNPSFIALFLSLAAWALLEAWLFAMHAGLRAHVLATATGLGLAVLSATGLKPGDRAAPDQAAPSPRRHRRAGAADAGALLFLAALGAATGFLVISGLSLVLAAAAISSSFLPWSRLSLCRHHPVASCSVTWAAFAASLFACRAALDLMFLPLASWILWVCAAIVLLVRAAGWRRGQRQGTSTPLGMQAQALLEER